MFYCLSYSHICMQWFENCFLMYGKRHPWVSEFLKINFKHFFLKKSNHRFVKLSTSIWLMKTKTFRWYKTFVNNISDMFIFKGRIFSLWNRWGSSKKIFALDAIYAGDFFHWFFLKVLNFCVYSCHSSAPDVRVFRFFEIDSRNSSAQGCQTMEKFFDKWVMECAFK